TKELAGNDIQVVPGDTSFIYQIKDSKFWCIKKQAFSCASSIWEQYKENQIYYFSVDLDNSNLANNCANDFEKQLKNRQGIYFKNTTQDE
ncbi:MAG: hypothetical protein K8S56_06515, partial [Candidatus Cloacimonetes bacterium]|nr:hypothetical protein [Candidatus Cloacimonadota bacterium]